MAEQLESDWIEQWGYSVVGLWSLDFGLGSLG